MVQLTEDTHSRCIALQSIAGCKDSLLHEGQHRCSLDRSSLAQQMGDGADNSGLHARLPAFSISVSVWSAV